MAESAETGQKKADDVPADAKLTVRAAVWNALTSKDLEFYPRVVEGSDTKSLDSSACITDALGVSKNWDKLDSTSTNLDGAIKLARESLTEVTKQTEYQDQKATRLLTVTTFLTAFAGALFTRVLDAYPVPPMPWVLDLSFERILIFLTYGAFVAFIMSALFGALVIFHATRTRFKYPNHPRADSTTPPKSLLFYAGIIGARPSTWMQAWVTEAGGGEAAKTATLNAKLKTEYFKNLVLETYLVAAKTADKLRYLQPAQSLLAWSMRILFFWLVLMILLFAFAPSTKPPAKPTKVEVVEPVVLTPPSIVAPASPTPAPGAQGN